MTTILDRLRKLEATGKSLDLWRLADLLALDNALPALLACAAALREATTNGEWSDGEQQGEWKMLKDVYDTMAAALVPLLKEVK